MSNFWRQRRVLVTGGTGFLGYHLTQLLLDAGARVRSFALPSKGDHPLTGLPVESCWGDIRDAAAVRRAAAGCDLVFHTAGPVAVWGPAVAIMHAAHRDGIANVIAAMPNGVRIVHTSSIVAVGATTRGDVLDEESPFNLNIKVDYVHAKRSAEIVAMDAAASGRDVVVCNPGYLIGPEDHEPSVMGKLCDRVWRGKMTVAAPGGFNLVDVRDVAAGHLLAAERGVSGRRYILGGENLKLAGFISRLALAGGMKPRGTPTVPNALMWAAAMVAEARAWKIQREPYPSFQHARINRYAWFVKSDRAARELGYSPRTLNDTIRDTFAWHAARGVQPLRGFTRWWMRPAA